MKKWLPQMISILLGFLLFGLAIFVEQKEGAMENGYIKRGVYGSYDSQILIDVEGLTDDTVTVEIPVSNREYSDEEIDEVFEACFLLVKKEILGENTSLQEVETDLKLMSKVSSYGIQINWYSQDPELVRADGKVYNENIDTPIDTVLHLDLTDRKHMQIYQIPITVIPKHLTTQEALLKRFSEMVESIDKREIYKEGFQLPKEFEGKKLVYTSNQNKDLHLIWILGIVVAFLLFVKDKIATKEIKEKREKQLANDYPEIVSKLIIFVGAGLSIRSSWEGIVNDYELDLQRGTKERYAYEEMKTALLQMKIGVHETKIYREFGRKCGIRQYMKLATILEQNRKTGLSNLKSILSLESQSAWEERVNMARREGEELSTKLLLPLFIMLGIVMLMIMVPALMTFY